MLFTDYLTPFIAGAVCTGCAIVGFPALILALQTDPPRRLYLVSGAVACILISAALAHTYFGV